MLAAGIDMYFSIQISEDSISYAMHLCSRGKGKNDPYLLFLFSYGIHGMIVFCRFVWKRSKIQTKSLEISKLNFLNTAAGQNKQE